VSEYRDITPTCRANRGDYPAFDQAVHDLWHAYGVLLHRHPGATFRLTIARIPAQTESGGEAEQ
jgi:hypothetical protein